MSFVSEPKPFNLTKPRPRSVPMPEKVSMSKEILFKAWHTVRNQLYPLTGCYLITTSLTPLFHYTNIGKLRRHCHLCWWKCHLLTENVFLSDGWQGERDEWITQHYNAVPWHHRLIYTILHKYDSSWGPWVTWVCFSKLTLLAPKHWTWLTWTILHSLGLQVTLVCILHQSALTCHFCESLWHHRTVL